MKVTTLTAQRGDGKKIALLGAFCLFLSAIEYLIPKPLPFMRLGLANLPILLALNEPISSFAVLVAIKIIGQSLISGTLFSYVFLFSLAGSLVSAAAMYFLRRITPEYLIGFTGISISGAILSNLTQLLLARYFILGKGALLIAPPFLASGLITGAALGLFCEKFCSVSKWYKGEIAHNADKCGGSGEASLRGEAGAKTFAAKGAFSPTKFPAIDLFAAGVIMSGLLLFNPSTAGRAAQFVLFFIFAAVSGKAGKPLYTVVFFLGIVFFNLLTPYGRFYFNVGALRITEGALLAGVRKAATVEGLMMLSRVTISSALRLPGKFGSLISESFAILEIINENKKRITARNLMSDIDCLLIELSVSVNNAPQQMQKPPRTFKSTFVLVCACLLTAVGMGL
ncbi:membrane protein [Spirochaetia bacterium]|nr:membrane protein [Spirochaetia bacterium]